MADDPTPNPDPTPVNPEPSLLSQPAPNGDPPLAKTSDQVAAEAESAKRVEAWTGATELEARKAAYAALTPEEKAAAFKGLKPEDAKALGIEDPAIPVYTEFKMPEGFKLDAEAMKPALDLFKESRLPQDQAQKFIDLALSREKAAADRQMQAFVDTQNQWVSAIKADPEIGGTKLQASLAAAARAIDRLAIPGLKDALNLTGAGNHPDVVKAFVRVGQLMSEDRFAPGHPPAPNPPRSPAEVIYDGGPKQSADA